MKEFFENLWKDYVLSAIVTVIAGVLITVFYRYALDIVCVVLGIAAIIMGIFSIIRYIRYPMALNRFSLLMGLIFCAIGIYIVVKPSMLINIVAVVFGILILFHGIVDVQQTVALKRAGYRYWPLALVFSILTLAAGIVFIVLPKDVIQSITLVLGITLIVEGTMDLWTAIKVKKING